MDNTEGQTAENAVATKQATVKSTEPERYEAVLVRGKSYTYKHANFKKGEPRIVSKAVKEYLEEKAYDEVTVGSGADAEVQKQPKFKFTRVRSR